MKRVELYYFNGCPSWQPALENLKRALSAEGLPDAVDLVTVESEADAQAMRFLGSPSIRIDGADVEGPAAEARGCSFGCRVYRDGDRSVGWPSVDQIRHAIQPGRQA